MSSWAQIALLWRGDARTRSVLIHFNIHFQPTSAIHSQQPCSESPVVLLVAPAVSSSPQSVVATTTRVMMHCIGRHSDHELSFFLSEEAQGQPEEKKQKARKGELCRLNTVDLLYGRTRYRKRCHGSPHQARRLSDRVGEGPLLCCP